MCVCVCVCLCVCVFVCLCVCVCVCVHESAALNSEVFTFQVPVVNSVEMLPSTQHLSRSLL